MKQIINKLKAHQAKKLPPSTTKQAAVALLLPESENGPEVLFIRRADYAGDPWSGDIAFPGGGMEAEDAGPRQAAEREVREEIGLQLEAQQYLGQLDDLAGAYLPVTVYCFVYLLAEKPQLHLSDELVDSFWVPLAELLSPQRRKQASFSYRDTKRSHPIIDLDGYCERFLWGISYRLLDNLLSLPASARQD